MSDRRIYRVGFWLSDASLEYGGIGPYAFRVLASLLEDFEPGWHFLLLCSSALPEGLKKIVSDFSGLAEVRLIPSAPPGLDVRIEEAHESANILRPRVEAGELPVQGSSNYLTHWLNDLDLDLLHFPTQTILHRDLQIPYRLTMYGVEELSHAELNIPFIVTMHDVQELHFPQNFTPAQRAIRAVQYWKAMEKAREVIVSFNHVKEDLLKFFDLPPDKVHVCPIPFRSISLREPTSEAALSYGKKYGGPHPFLLYPSHTWRHKNHLQLLRALKEVHRRYSKNLRLVCTGGTNHHYHAEVLSQVEALGLGDAVNFAGIVPEDELYWLYKHAEMVAIPTRYEAGSFPLFEAILLNVPVICSDVTSLPETINDGRFIFDPDNVEDLANLIIRLLSDAHFRQENIANSLIQADRLRRINAASYFYETYRSLLGIPPVG